jgi:choline dehydrogenase-like flavoprotein
VLLLEAGPELQSPMERTPGPALAFLGSDSVYGGVTVNQAAAAGRGIALPTGRGLGGGSSVNTMTWFQGHPADYDGWRDQGADGWGWEDMLPVARQVEHHILGDGPFHGGGGPMTVDFARDVRSRRLGDAGDHPRQHSGPDHHDRREGGQPAGRRPMSERRTAATEEPARRVAGIVRPRMR